MTDDQSRWLAVCADVLASADPGASAAHLSAGLMDLTHADVGIRMRVEQTPFGIDVDLEMVANRPVPSPETWQREAMSAEHPFTRYYRSATSLAPVSLDQVRRAGYDFTGPELERHHRLGSSPHQLSLPISGDPSAFEGWAFISAAPYSDDEVERVGRLQRLIIGLDRHVQAQRADRGLHDGLAAYSSASHLMGLTERERTVLILTRAGLTASAMGTRLGVSPRTVHKHQENLYRKLGATDRLSAVLAAQRLGLLS